LQRSKKVEDELSVQPLEKPGYPKPSALRCFIRSNDGQSLLVPRFSPPAQTLDTVDDRRPKPEDVQISFNGILRPLQVEAMDATMGLLRGCGGSVLSLAPGQGKTACAFYAMAQLKVKTLVIVHKQILLEQWRERARHFVGQDIGRIQQNVFEDANIVVAMIQTLCSRDWDARAFSKFGLLVVDEAHHVPANVFSRAMFLLCPKYTLGLTATPDRADGCERALFWFLGPQSFISVRKCDPGTACYTALYIKEYDQEDRGLPTRWDGTLNQSQYITDIAVDETRNREIANAIQSILSKDRGRKMIILTDRKYQADLLRLFLKDHGARIYYGGMKQEELSEAAKGKVIIATYGIASEGLDIPDVDTVVLASPRSDVRQAIGRAMRDGTVSRSHSTLIVDVVDTWGSVAQAMFRKRKNIYEAQCLEYFFFESKY